MKRDTGRLCWRPFFLTSISSHSLCYYWCFVSASASISGSATATSHAPSTSSCSGSATIGPTIRKSRLDSFFVPRTTLGSQPSLEDMGWNKEVHDVAKMAVGRFWSYSCIPFFVAR